MAMAYCGGGSGSSLNPSATRVCRVCLLQKMELFSIFEHAYAINGTTVAQMLSECTRYRAEYGDKMPQEICSDCMVNARNAFYFKRQTEEAYRTLLGIAEEELDVKVHQQQQQQLHCANNFMGESKPKQVERGSQTDKVSLYPCELCDMKFFDTNDLRGHRASAHHSSSNQCRVCGKRFENIRQLRTHLWQEHPGMGFELGIQCTICRRKFSRREHLRRHLRNVHKQQQPQNHTSRSIKDLLKEPEIELNMKTEVKLSMDKVESSGLDPSHFLECVQNEANSDDSESEHEVANPISSDDEAYTGMELPDDILPQLKIEPEAVVKVEHTDSFMDNDDHDHDSTAYNWERTEPGVEDVKCKMERTSLEQSQNGTVYNLESEEFVKDHTTRYRVKGAVDEYLAQNGSFDGKANGENRCTECQRTFSRHCHLRRHMLSHVEEKAHACTYCGKRFARSDHLKKHVLNLHHSKDFKCDQCSCAFACEKELLKHRMVRHSGDPHANKVHNCEYCGKKFTTTTYLRKHILMHTDRIYACKFCDETFKDRKLYREHVKTHSKGRNFLCSICGESFVRNDYLRVHMRRHSGEKPYKCQYCGKGFPRATDVKMHERYHTNHKPNLCTLCGKGFHRAYNLTIHMRTHTGERPFKCDQCDKSFAQGNDLKAHIRRHTGERFKCSVCDAGFLQMYALRQHALNVHGIQMDPPTGRLQKFSTPPATHVSSATATLTSQQQDQQQQLLLQEQPTPQLSQSPLMPPAQMHQLQMPQFSHLSQLIVPVIAGIKPEKQSEFVPEHSIDGL